MHSGRFVFAQVMEYLPMKTFRRCVLRYHSDPTINAMLGLFVPALVTPLELLGDGAGVKMMQTDDRARRAWPTGEGYCLLTSADF